MKKITHWVLGTATARVSGDTARFMNIAVKTGLRPIRLQKDGKDVLFTLYAKDYKKLHKIKQRTHARVKLAEKSGFPFPPHAAPTGTFAWHGARRGADAVPFRLLLGDDDLR